MVYWMLRRIAKSPTYGFEILKEIEVKSEGAWRPGPGSVYPLLKRMVRLGYLESKADGGGRTDQRLYKITRKGIDHLEERKDMFRMMGGRWSSLRGIFADLIEPEAVPDFILAGSRKQFELAKQIVSLNKSKIPDTEFRSMLKEYSLLLESQQNWARRELRATPLVRHRGTVR